MTGAGLASIGVATPSGALDVEAALRMAQRMTCADERRSAALARLYRQCGVETRRIAFLDDTDRPPLYGGADRGGHNPTTGQRMARYLGYALPLGERAAHDALSGAGVGAHQITHLVTVSCTGFAAPGLDLALLERLALPRDTQRVHVGYMGCHGAVNGLRVAAALARAEPSARVLLCCVEVCSLHFQFDKRQGSAVANALFGDGAAACIVHGDAGAGGPQVVTTRSLRLPDSSDAMTWIIGDHGFEMSLSPRVPELIRAGVREWVASWAPGGIDAVRGWAIHPGGPRVIEAVGGALGLSDDQAAASRGVLRRLGNMSSPTLLFILRDLLREEPRGAIVGLAFGPGLSAEGVLIGR